MALMLVGCKPTTTAVAPETGSEPVPVHEEVPRVPAGPTSHCVDDMIAEVPVTHEALGEGDKYLRVENATAAELRARLVDETGTPVLDGTLLVPGNGTASFNVPAGKYQLRIREELRCVVFIGEVFEIRSAVNGVAVTIAFEYGPDGDPLGLAKASGGL